MAKTQFEYLNIRYQKRYKNKGFKMKENTGLDTETYKGYVKLICDHTGAYAEIQSFDDIIEFLVREKFKGSYNWFYNIQYDFESMIKYLDYAELLELYQEHELQYNKKFKIKYIPKKFFAIMSNTNNNYYFYDLYAFLDTSLNKASKKFLKDEKLSNTVDANLLNTDLQYWSKHKSDIIKYCIKDADLTKRLADYFWDIIYEKLNFYPKQPMSKGKLSEEYFLHKCDIPTINAIPEKAIKIAYDSFYGGHFEILKRGYFPSVYCYDIKSAYPAEIAELIDYTKGKWRKCIEMDENCHTGFYKCKIESMEKYFSPFKQKVGGSAGLNVYPNGTFTQYLTKKEIQFYRLHFPNSAINIEFGYEFYPKTEEKPFKLEIERLYQWKDSESDPDIKYCVKIILNSLYGKFIQVSGNYNQTGKLFNPIYAANITAGARIKILELALQDRENIISFSTDSVTCKKPLNVPKNPKMGEFELDFEGEGVFIMSDVYNLWNNKTQKIKSKLRGFSLALSKDIETGEVYLKDILAGMDNTLYEYYTSRPYHLGECIAHRKKRKIEDVNIFGKMKKTIDINGDNKRVWDKDFINGKKCLEENHNSYPLLVVD
jgi:hypothetical protein